MWGCSSTMLPGLGGPLGLLTYSLLLMLLLYVAFKVARTWRFNDSASADKRDSLEILKVRLAKGEISRDEFNELKNLL